VRFKRDPRGARKKSLACAIFFRPFQKASSGATLVLCPSITMERLTLEDFTTLIRVERESWYTVSSSLVGGVGTFVISIKSDKDRDAKSAPHAFIGVLAG
jgi:hypothetical protein